jgi:hypothetical protein
VTPACPNCNAPLAPYGPKGYDSASPAVCADQRSEDCPVDICSECAAFWEVDQSADGENWTDTVVKARCFACEIERELVRGHNSADPRFA